MEELSCISPIDGRYSKQTEPLKNYFSEAALIKYRIIVECEYFLYLAGQKTGYKQGFLEALDIALAPFPRDRVMPLLLQPRLAGTLLSLLEKKDLAQAIAGLQRRGAATASTRSCDAEWRKDHRSRF